MTDLTLTDMIVQMIETIRGMDATDVEDAISEAGDLLQSGDRSDDLWTDSVLDGLSWGHRAAGCVEMGGSTLLRLLAPGGVRITHEWHGGISEVGRSSVLDTVMTACDQGRMVAKTGVSGMTIEANIRGSVYMGVPAWPIEEARDTLAKLRAHLEGERE